MLEGFLTRVARCRDADAFALRGGMLVHAWIPDAGRAVGDVDLVCRLPFDRKGVRARLRAILADRGVVDGVVFDADRFRIDASAPGDPRPGLTLFAAGEVDGAVAEVTIDLLRPGSTSGRPRTVSTRGCSRVRPRW